jgi:predicted DNA-binding protein (UPF0251 family)/DNA-directed RNA polymerase subunit RPC12/RpoP
MIENAPAVPFFVPSEEGIPEVSKNILLVEELEALRLKDLEGLEQEECAEKMEISRATFQRILLSAREKVADSLVNGKLIHIDGGNYTFHMCSVKCMVCGKEWMESHENLMAVKNGEYTCPDCGSANILREQSCRGMHHHKNCRHRHGSNHI